MSNFDIISNKLLDDYPLEKLILGVERYIINNTTNYEINRSENNDVVISSDIKSLMQDLDNLGMFIDDNLYIDLNKNTILELETNTLISFVNI